MRSTRLPDGETRREIPRSLAEEEGVDSPQARPHSDLWLDFAAAFGASRSAVAAHALASETVALRATFRKLMQHESGAAAMAALYAYESRVPAIAATKAAGLTEHYGVQGQAAVYFTLHQTADVAHASVWRELIAARLADAPEEQTAVLAVGDRAARALWTALDGIEQGRTQRRGSKLRELPQVCAQA